MTRVQILAPMTGRVVPIDEVPDPVFAERMIGDGVAIEPTGSVGVAPISGTLVVFHSAGHAFAIEGESGVSVLVHVGLDTVNLKGRGFTRLAEAGDTVTAGQELVRFDLLAIAAENLSSLSPVVLPQLDPTYRVAPTTAGHVEAGRDVLLTVELPDPVPAGRALSVQQLPTLGSRSLKAIVGGTVFTPDRRIEDGLVLVDGSTVRAVGSAQDIEVPQDAERIEAQRRLVTPGLVDVHTHGLLGHDVMGPGLSEAIPAFPAYGVTSFMATTLTETHEETLAGLRSMAEQLAQPERFAPGARCLGIHIEGPYLSYKRPGMARPEWTEELTWEGFEELQAAAGGFIKMATFAPERGEAMSVIPRLVESGVIAVLGHSDATFDEAAQAIGLGVNHATHTYNAMRPLNHRDPGAVGAVMYYDQVVAELVGDGIHVHPVAMALLIRIKGIDRVALISDSAPVAGLPPGEYEWGGQPVFVRDGRCELTNGTIAGAHALLDDGVRRLAHEVSLPLQDVFVLAARTPADSVGATHKGRLAAGADADIVLYDDELRPTMTLVEGEVVWSK